MHIKRLIFAVFSIVLVCATMVGCQDKPIPEPTPEQKADIDKEFKEADKDENGFVCIEELKIAIPSLGEEDITNFMEQADKNKDGVLTYQEYSDIYMRYEIGGYDENS